MKLSALVAAICVSFVACESSVHEYEARSNAQSVPKSDSENATGMTPDDALGHVPISKPESSPEFLPDDASPLGPQSVPESTPAFDPTRISSAVFFNFPPLTGQHDLSLENKIIELVNAAAPGSSVHISLYHLSRTPVSQAIIAASQRGVTFNILLDKSHTNDDGTLWQAVQLLKDNLPQGSLILCGTGKSGGACLGSNINHNKFFLFSQLSDGSRYVVAQSSANLTTTQLTRHNNTVVVRNDKALYDVYLKYWQDQKSQRRNPNYYATGSGTSGAKAYFFPRASGDTIEGVLNNVICSPQSRIAIAMSLFTKTRANITTKLGKLQKQGCMVRVITNFDQSIVPDLRQNGIVHALYPPAHARKNDVSVHSKYLIIESNYGADAGSASWQRLVWTGSHNYTKNALRSNDETLLKLSDPALVDAFWQNWKQIWAVTTGAEFTP